MSHQKINSLQLLRAIAVSQVILIHACFSGVSEITPINPAAGFYNLMPWGAIGVDLFFAISGFIMTVVLPAYITSQGWKKFFTKRIVRIVPLYYLLSFFEFVAVVRHHVMPTPDVLIKTIIFFPLFDHKKFSVPLIGVGWSLSYEMYFYLLITILLIFKKDIWKRLLILIAALSLIGLVFNPANAMLRFLTSSFLLEFGLGVSCGLLFNYLINSNYSIAFKKTLAITITLLGLTLMLATLFINVKYPLYDQHVSENNNWIALYRVAVWGVPSALFMLGVILTENVYQIIIPSLLIICGDASYSCYLIHWHFGVWIARIIRYTHLSAVSYLVIVIPVVLAVSVAFYFLVEKPLTNAMARQHKN